MITRIERLRAKNNKKIQVLNFSSTSSLNSELEKKLNELIEENSALNEDLEAVTHAVRAASKIDGGQVPSQKEKDSFLDLRENYSSYFDSEDSDEGERSSSLLNRIMKIKRYLDKERKYNRESIDKLVKKSMLLKSDEEISKIGLGTIEKGESSKTGSDTAGKEESSKEDLSIIGKGKAPERDYTINKGKAPERDLGVADKNESLKRKAEHSDSEESVSSKKSRQSASSVIDYIESLPYNPFDDIGTD